MRMYIRGSESRGASFTDSFDCPICRAVRRKTGLPIREVSVGPNGVSLYPYGVRLPILNGRGSWWNVQPHINHGTGFHITVKGLENYVQNR